MAGAKGRAVPLRQRAGGHHVGMAGKNQSLGFWAVCGGKGLAFGPEVGHTEIGRATFDGFAHKAQHLQALRNQRLAACVSRCDRCKGQQLLGELQGGMGVVLH